MSEGTLKPRGERESDMDPFTQFMRGIAADARLGRLFPGGLATQSPEVVVLNLAMRLADACEGRQMHPAYRLLEEIDAAEAKR